MATSTLLAHMKHIHYVHIQERAKMRVHERTSGSFTVEKLRGILQENCDVSIKDASGWMDGNG